MKLVIANWKNNPASVEEAVNLAKATDQEGLVICPPDKFLLDVAPYIKKGKLGAQDLFWEETPPPKVGYAIVGHSDRRYGLGESDKAVAQKFITAIDERISPVLCVGETLEEKQQGDRERVIEKQIISAFRKLSTLHHVPSDIYVAYEPIWAISTGSPPCKGGVRGGNFKPDNPDNAVTAILFVKNLLTGIVPRLTERIHFLYGGSITSQNAEKFLKHPEIEGFLVGRASLDLDEINKINKSAQMGG